MVIDLRRQQDLPEQAEFRPNIHEYLNIASNTDNTPSLFHLPQLSIQLIE